jgi:hypothetical protein
VGKPKTHGYEAIRAHVEVIPENVKMAEITFGLFGGDEVVVSARVASLRTLSDQLAAILLASSKAAAKKRRDRTH